MHHITVKAATTAAGPLSDPDYFSDDVLTAAAGLFAAPPHRLATQWWLEALASVLGAAAALGPLSWGALLLLGLAGKVRRWRRPLSAEDEAAAAGVSLIAANEQPEGGVLSNDF